MILLDSHVALWLAVDPSKLSSKATTAIQESRHDGTGLAICDVTLLELTTIINKGRVQLNISLELFLQDLAARFVILPISVHACSRIHTLPQSYPKDPADRIIGATALVEGIPLLTADREIRLSKAVRTIW